MAWSTTFGTWEPKLGGTQGREGWLKAGGVVGEGRMALWNGDKMVGEETRDESSSFWYGGLTGDAITLDCSAEQDPCIETQGIAG